jgi:inorganic pyrophosphatase
MARPDFSSLPPFDKEAKAWNVIIETPRGCRNKLKFDDQAGVFKLSGVLPAGSSFPFDFGFLPSTLGPDGDPLDVLLLMDEAVFPGCLVSARLIGVIEAKQTERDGKTARNDRLIAIATHSQDDGDIRSLKDLNNKLVDEIEHFFVSYNQVRGKKFKPLGRFGPARAEKLVKDGMKAFTKERGR